MNYHATKLRAGLVGALLASAFTSSPAFAEDWPQDFKKEFRSGCLVQADKIGFRQDKAFEYCACMADEAEDEWPLENIGELLTASSTPASSPVNQRLTAIADQCIESNS